MTVTVTFLEKDMRPLTIKQSNFLAALIETGNASEAYRRAYAAGGMSAKAVGVAATRLAADPRIALAVEQSNKSRLEEADVTADRIVAEMRRLAFYDLSCLADVEITGPKDIAKLPEDVRRAIIGYGWDKAGNFTLKFANKAVSLDQLARYRALYKDKLELTGKDGGPLQAVLAVTNDPREASRMYGDLLGD